MKILDRPSPNFDDRPPGQPVELLILHYTGMQSAAAALDRLCDPAAEVSCHWFVDEDGTVWRLVAEDKRAWHAGKSWWRGRDGTNARSIGIELHNPGHEFGYRPFPPAQMEALIWLCRGILGRHPIPARNVIGHSDVAPLRKTDPGELFDWQGLAAAGIGFLPSPAPPVPEHSARQALLDFGYGPPDLPADALIRAFQRHFRPSSVTGTWDEETRALIAGLGAAP